MEQTSAPFPGSSEETVKLKRTYNRAGLSVAALYGTIARGESIAIILIVGILSALAIGGWLPAANVDSILNNGGFYIEEYLDSIIGTGILATALTVLLLVQALFWIVGCALMRVILPERTPIEKRTLSFGRFLVIALMCFGVWGVGAALGNLSSFFGVETQTMLDPSSFGVESLPYLIYAVVGAPIVEELTFRKALCDGLHGTHEGYTAVVSGLLFGLMHGNHKQFFLAFFLGMLFAMVYQRTGRIVYTMLLHAMINFTATLPELLALVGIDIDLVWNIVIAALIAAGLIVLLIRRRDPLLHTPKCTIPVANNAVFRNVGMNIVRIAALVLIGVQGLILVFMPMLSDGDPLHLIDLLPLTLVFLTVLLLPVFTKRYEQIVTEEESA